MQEIIDKAKLDMESQEEKLVKLMKRVRIQYSIGSEFLADGFQDMST